MLTQHRGEHPAHTAFAFQGTQAERAGDHLVTPGTSSSPPQPHGKKAMFSHKAAGLL